MCPQMVPALMKVVWRYAFIMCGVLLLMTAGVSMTLPLPVLNSDTTEMVSAVQSCVLYGSAGAVQ